jgi:hypothetical protein
VKPILTISGAVLALSLLCSANAGETSKGGDPDIICKVNGEPITLKDLELAIYWGDYARTSSEVIDTLVKEHVVRQEVSRKGVSIKSSEIDEFVADLDRTLKTADRTKSLAEHLSSQGMDMDFFRRKTESTIGLCRLAGGRGRLEETLNPAVQAKMNELLAVLVASAKVETDPEKLEAGVAATVGGERIAVEEAARAARMVFGPEIKKKHLSYLQARAMIRQEMGHRKLELTSADLDYQTELICAKRASEIGEKNLTLGDVLRKMGRDPKLMRRQTDFQARAMLSRMVRSEVTDEDLRKLFASDPARFGDGVPKASHIMLRTVDDQGRSFPADADLKVRARLEALREKLLAGEDFSAMAGKFSDDKDTANRGGNVGFLDKSRIVDPVVAAAYSLKVGEISRPVKGSAGWHLIKVVEIKHTSFDDVKAEVRAQAIAERSAQLLKELSAKSKIESGPAGM